MSSSTSTETSSSKASTSTSEPVMYLVTSVVSHRKECFNEGDVESKAFASEDDAKEYMEKRAKALFYGLVLYGESYDVDEPVDATIYGRNYYFDCYDSLIDFGGSGQGYRSYRETWGFVKIDEITLLPAGVVIT